MKISHLLAIDPGFRGNITLELCNLSPYDLALPIGMKICQLAAARLDAMPTHSYGERDGNTYQDSAGLKLPKTTNLTK